MKNVLITGGSRGIGASLVREFAKKEYNVAFVYKSADDKAAALKAETGAMPIKADLSNACEAEAAVSAAIDALGGVDILVNNAGISSFSLFTDISNDDWQNMISNNLTSAFVCSREAVKGMIKNKSGRIINVSSMWGITGASCEVHYSAAKAGIIGMTKALAKELGPSNITVNCVCPGVIDTDMNAMLTEEDRASLCDETPLCRMGNPYEVAKLIVFLASDDASFITGQVISADGGFAI